jgi:hypothetical protein
MKEGREYLAINFNKICSLTSYFVKVLGLDNKY